MLMLTLIMTWSHLLCVWSSCWPPWLLLTLRSVAKSTYQILVDTAVSSTSPLLESMLILMRCGMPWHPFDACVLARLLVSCFAWWAAMLMTDADDGLDDVAALRSYLD